MNKVPHYIVFFLFITLVLQAQSDSSIVPLASIDSTIVSDVRYATVNNFTGEVLYPTNRVFIRKVVGEALSKAHSDLWSNYNLRIKIFDGYRPLSVQKKMWEIFPDDRYVANPASGSRHNRGAAIDITIIDSTGIELEMGTEYDNFTEKAHYDYQDLPLKVKENRIHLRTTLMKYGFEGIETEWWHFDYKGWKDFSILDEQIN